MRTRSSVQGIPGHVANALQLTASCKRVIRICWSINLSIDELLICLSALLMTISFQFGDTDARFCSIKFVLQWFQIEYSS